MVYGLCNILVFGEGPFNIVEKIRNFTSTHLSKITNLNCMMCLPTQVGLILSILNLWLLPTLPLTPFNILLQNSPHLWYLIISCDMFATSGVVWLLHTFQEYYESWTNLNNSKLEDDE